MGELSPQSSNVNSSSALSALTEDERNAVDVMIMQPAALTDEQAFINSPMLSRSPNSTLDLTNPLLEEERAAEATDPEEQPSPEDAIITPPRMGPLRSATDILLAALSDERRSDERTLEWSASETNMSALRNNWWRGAGPLTNKSTGYYYLNGPTPFLRDCRRKSTGARAGRQRHLVVLEISGGRTKRHFVQTPELLRLVHAHNSEGRVNEGEAGSLKLRDLRQICSQGLDGGHRASIELRRNCILFNLVGVRCIIMHEKVILIPKGCGNTSSRHGFPLCDEERFGLSCVDLEEDALVQKLVKVTEIRHASGHFEFAVLESLLVEVCSYLNDELSPILEEADQIRNITVGRLSSALRLHEIGEFKRKLDSVCDKLKGAAQAIQELLDNEEDLRRLELTRFWLSPLEWEHPHDTPASEDAEMLLECYEQELEGMLRQATRIDESLDDSLQIVQLHLASIRNAFLKSELGLDVVGTVVGCVGAIAGIFGMNIPNGWEQNNNVFWPMTQIMLLICALTAVLVVIMFKRVQL